MVCRFPLPFLHLIYAHEQLFKGSVSTSHTKVVKRWILPLHHLPAADHVDVIPCALRVDTAALQVKVSVTDSLAVGCFVNAGQSRR